MSERATDHDGPSGESIVRLDDETVRRIAAGEVVERPASAVKELVENALDAGAERVEVSVDGDGTDRLRVRDDGHGMTAAALERAVEEHTTSKITDATDLERVDTLGFRGEALHTIAAVSRLTIRSRPPGADRGHAITVEGGDAGGVEPVGCPPGTVVEVSDLFYNTPARREFLGRESTEFDRVNRIVTQYALANPGTAVSLEHDGREVFATDGRGDRESTVMAVYGREVAAAAVDVDAAPGDLPAETGGVSGVSGLVTHPETTRASRDYLATFVNGRYVPAETLRDAVVDAYGGQLAADRYPFAVLFVDVDPTVVDVNVHPRKTAVRWSDPEGVERAVRSAVSEALLDEGVVRSSAPRGRSAPEQATIEPSGVNDRGDADAPNAPGGADVDEPSGSVAGAGGTTGGSRGAGGGSGTRSDADGESSGTDGAGASEGTSTDTGAASAAGANASAGEGAGETASAGGGAGETASAGEGASADPGETESTSTDANASESAASGPTGAEPASRTGATQRTLSGGDVHATTEYDSFPDLRVLGQLHDTYVVAEAPDGLVLVDQHAADERVNYERLRDRIGDETTTQALADPVRVEVTPGEAELVDAHGDALARLGFRATRVDEGGEDGTGGTHVVEVTTVPAPVAEAAGPAVIRDVLGDLVDRGADPERTVDAVADDLLADMACYPSITGNTSLTEGSVVELLAALDGCENPWACPHGRPVLIRVDADEIDERFERDYPGHGG